MAEADEQGGLPLDYARPERRRTRWQFLLWMLLGGIVVALGMSISSEMSGYRAIEEAKQVQCRSNLRQIGQAITLYCIDHRGQYPDSVATMFFNEANEGLGVEVFVWPDSKDTPATGATTQVVAGNLLVPGHCSYIYIGNGLNSRTVAANTVVAYEPVANHGGAGMNVLFGDGHVEFVSATLAGQIGARVSAKVFPVTMPTN
jgi:prepilin-type processing-associated H-X9-DG protein